jgi:hypothetical protein
VSIVGIGGSVFLIAIGAILEYALPHSVGGIRLGSIGVILMIIGILGLAVAVLLTAPWSRGQAEPSGRVVEPEPGVVQPEREVVVERHPVEREVVVRDSDTVVEQPVRKSRRAW